MWRDVPCPHRLGNAHYIVTLQVHQPICVRCFCIYCIWSYSIRLTSAHNVHSAQSEHYTHTSYICMLAILPYYINNVFVYNLFTALRFSFCYSVCKDSESRTECKEKVIIFFYCRDASYFRRSQSYIIFLIVQRYRGKTLARGSWPEGHGKCCKAKWLYLKRLWYRRASVLNSPGNSWNSLNSLCFIK